MNITLYTAIVAALAAILASIVTAIANSYVSRQKIKELHFEYENKLRDSYLQNAREYTKNLYIPLSVSLSKLRFSYQLFRSYTETNKQSLLDSFNSEIDAFLFFISELSQKGANAFFTTDLDEALQDFCSFLMSSKLATETKYQLELRFSTSGLINQSLSTKSIVSGKLPSIFKNSKLGFDMFPFKVSYVLSEIVAAPIESKDFFDRFSKSIHLLNVLIKEVTLGAKARR